MLFTHYLSTSISYGLLQISSTKRPLYSLFHHWFMLHRDSFFLTQVLPLFYQIQNSMLLNTLLFFSIFSSSHIDITFLSNIFFPHTPVKVVTKQLPHYSPYFPRIIPMWLKEGNSLTKSFINGYSPDKLLTNLKVTQ